MYSTINKYATGICSVEGCSPYEQEGSKTGKDFRCSFHHTQFKQQIALEKAKKKNALRSDGSKVRKLGKMQDVSLEQKALNASKAAAMQRWFAERREEMKGKCAHCGGKTMKYNGDKFYYSIAHILPKAYFKSVATHPDNWIELCFWQNSCHSQMDNKMLDMTEMNCWDEIVVKFQKIYPFIAEEEKRRIPNILLEYLNTDK